MISMQKLNKKDTKTKLEILESIERKIESGEIDRVFTKPCETRKMTDQDFKIYGIKRIV